MRAHHDAGTDGCHDAIGTGRELGIRSSEYNGAFRAPTQRGKGGCGAIGVGEQRQILQYHHVSIAECSHSNHQPLTFVHAQSRRLSAERCVKATVWKIRQVPDSDHLEHERYLGIIDMYTGSPQMVVHRRIHEYRIVCQQHDASFD